jgi:hypothetical protein
MPNGGPTNNNNNNNADVERLAEELKQLAVQVKELSGSMWRQQNEITTMVTAKLDTKLDAMKSDITQSLAGVANGMNVIQDTLLELRSHQQQQQQQRPTTPPQFPRPPTDGVIAFRNI